MSRMYTVRTAQVTDAKRVDESWGTLRWLAGRSLGNAQGVVVGRVTIRPGHSNPRHSHSNCEEVLYLLSGRLKHTIGDEVVTLEAGDALVIARGAVHNATSIGDQIADIIVSYSSGVRESTPEA